MNTSLLTLPTELLHRIPDQLDTTFSFRHVCRRFYTVTKTYNRYKIVLSSISLRGFIHYIYRYISPENIAAMFVDKPLYESNQWLMFSIDLKRPTHLCSLNFHNIKYNDLFNLRMPSEFKWRILKILTNWNKKGSEQKNVTFFLLH
jgi:hypothetical protein